MKQLTYYDPAICVLGLSPAGLSLARKFSERYRTIGYDPDSSRIDELMNGHEVNGFTCTSDLEAIRHCNFYVVVAPPSRGVNIQSVAESLQEVSRLAGKVISCGDFLVYDASLRSLALENKYLPIVENESGLNSGKQFFVGHSFEKRNILGKKKRIISASTPEIQSIIEEIYAIAISRTKVSPHPEEAQRRHSIPTFMQQFSPAR